MAKQENLFPTETRVLTFGNPPVKAFHGAGHFKPAAAGMPKGDTNPGAPRASLMSPLNKLAHRVLGDPAPQGDRHTWETRGDGLFQGDLALCSTRFRLL